MNNETDRYSVLIFEDDFDLAKQWRTALESENIHVEHAKTVAAAQAHCAQKQFDVIVCDLFILDEKGEYIPRAGFTLINYLRDPNIGKMPHWGAEVPIIVVTGSMKTAGFDMLELAQTMGGTVQMRKPFTVLQLVDTVLSLIKVSPNRSETA